MPKSGVNKASQPHGTGVDSKPSSSSDEIESKKTRNGTYFGPPVSSTDHRLGTKRQRRVAPLSVQEVDRRLKALGIGPKKGKGSWGRDLEVSKCVRAAIQHGYIELKGEDKEELNQVIWKGKFYDYMCGHSKAVKLWEVLYQPDYAGICMEDYCTVICEEKDCDGPHGRKDDPGKMYLTDICSGNPSPDCGKSHNHCQKCPDFGVCIGDYRDMHCDKCKGHYFGGFHDSYRCHCQGGGIMGYSDSE